MGRMPTQRRRECVVIGAPAAPRDSQGWDDTPHAVAGKGIGEGESAPGRMRTQRRKDAESTL